MSEEEIADLKNRLQNTEKALLALMAILEGFQPSCVQDGLYRLNVDYLAGFCNSKQGEKNGF